MKRFLKRLLSITLSVGILTCNFVTPLYAEEVNNQIFSEETQEWLEWFNSLTYEEQITISYRPAEIIEYLNGDNAILPELRALDRIDNPQIETDAVIPNNPIGGGGGSGFDSYRTLPTGYQNATVTKRATVLSGQYAGMITYIVNLYLSNSSLMYYIEECLIGTSISNAALSLLAEFVVTTYIGTISGIAGVAITIALGVANIYNQIVNQSFYNQLVTIRRNGQKAHVQITESSKSVTTWTSSTIGYENSTRNGLKIESEIVAYKNF